MILSRITIGAAATQALAVSAQPAQPGWVHQSTEANAKCATQGSADTSSTATLHDHGTPMRGDHSEADHSEKGEVVVSLFGMPGTQWVVNLMTAMPTFSPTIPFVQLLSMPCRQVQVGWPAVPVKGNLLSRRP